MHHRDQLVVFGPLHHEPGCTLERIAAGYDSFTFPLNGTLSLNGVSTRFAGSFTGTNTFFFDGSDTVTGNISLTTGLGLATGTLTASANPQIVVREPGTLGMLLVAGMMLMTITGSYIRKRRFRGRYV